MKKKQTTIVLADPSQQLKKYAEELNALQTDIESNNVLAVKHGKLTLKLVMKAGEILIEAKKLVEKDWEKWIEQNVTSIGIRTAQNYMRLCRAALKEVEKINASADKETQHVSFLRQCEGLREAYIVVGIIKKPEGAARDKNTPEKMKAENKSLYGQCLAKAKINMAIRASNELKKGESFWRLDNWTIKNNKVRSVDEGNSGLMTIRSLAAWVSKNNVSDLTKEDAMRHKIETSLLELVRAILIANRPEAVEEFAFEVNREPAPTEPTTPEAIDNPVAQTSEVKKDDTLERFLVE